MDSLEANVSGTPDERSLERHGRPQGARGVKKSTRAKCTQRRSGSRRGDAPGRRPVAVMLQELEVRMLSVDPVFVTRSPDCSAKRGESQPPAVAIPAQVVTYNTSDGRLDQDVLQRHGARQQKQLMGL